MNRAADSRVLRMQALLCAAVVLVVALWPSGGPTTLLQALACGLGSIAIIAPNLAFSWWSSRRLGSAAGRAVPAAELAQRSLAERRGQQILGLAGLRLVGIMTLMVIAFMLMPLQAQWVLLGIVSAALGQVMAALIAAASR